jgi:hypothetical protein
MGTTTVISSEDQHVLPTPTRPHFFKAFWELKILLWGLGLIAVASAATYAWTMHSL